MDKFTATSRAYLEAFGLPVWMLEDTKFKNHLKFAWDCGFQNDDTFKSTVRSLFCSIIEAQKLVCRLKEFYGVEDYKQIPKGELCNSDKYLCVDYIADRISFKNLMEILGSKKNANRLIKEADTEKNKNKTLKQYLEEKESNFMKIGKKQFDPYQECHTQEPLENARHTIIRRLENVVFEGMKC